VRDGSGYLPREVFLTLAVFFGAFVDGASGVPAAAALSFCFRVAIGGSTFLGRAIHARGVPG